MEGHPNIIPGMRYRNAHSAIKWLEEIFGFTTRMVVEDGEGGIAHAQLTLGNGMIMLGSHREDTFGSVMTLPDLNEGLNTQSTYVVLNEKKLEKVYQRVLASEADIVMPLEAQEYGGKNFSCRDLEGHVWSFGSYDPYQEDIQ